MRRMSLPRCDGGRRDRHGYCSDRVESLRWWMNVYRVLWLWFGLVPVVVGQVLTCERVAYWQLLGVDWDAAKQNGCLIF